MAEGIGALLVRIGADAGDFFTEVGRVDTQLEKLGRKVDKHTKEWMKFGGAAAAAGASVFAFTKNAADVVDALGKMSQRVGVSVESLSALKYAANLSDVSLDQLGQGLKQLSKFMVENNLQGVSTEEQLLRIADEFGRTNDGAVKTAAAMKYFGKSGADMIPLLNMGRAGIEELRKEAERLGIVFSAEAAKKAEEFNDNLTRLQFVARGLQVQFAGPLVEALNKTAQAMLEANARGETLFQTLIEGFRRLTTGDDLHKWNVEFTEATNRLGAAQNNVSRLASIGGWAAAKGLKKAREEVAAVEDDIKRLLAIKPILAPEEKPKPAPGRTGDPSVPGADMGKDAEMIAKQWEWWAEEEARIMSEVAQITSDYRAAELELERAFYDERNRVLIEAHDREQEEEIRQGQELIDIDEAISKAKKQQQAKQLADASNFLGNLASLTNTNSRKMFEIGKVAAIAQAGVKGALGVMDAWEAGMSVGGPWAPVIAAAYAAAAGIASLNLISSIRSQSFGGGGGAPTPAGQGASGIAAPSAPSGTGESSREQTTIIKGLNPDELFTGRRIRQLFERFNEGERDGGRFVFA